MRTDSPLLRYYYQKLPKYQETGQVTADGCPQGFTKNALGMCVNEAGQTPDQAVAASNILKDVTKKPVVNTKPLATPYKTVSQQVTEATDKARRENYHLDNQATVGQGQASTIDSERARAEKLQQYTNEHPYAQVNSQGNLERTNWDRSMETGQADKGTPAGRTDRFLNDAAISMGIAGDIMTLGELGSGLTGMRSAISNSAEGLSGVKQSGFLGNSKEMFTNPKRYFTKPTSGPTFNPNYENIGRAARGEGDAFGETLSWGDWQEAPRVLDWEKIAETVAGIGIGSGAISGGPSQQKKDGGLHRYQIDGQTKEEITYSHRPRGIEEGFMLNRTQIPYTSYRDIKRNTKVPTDPREVNFISNYAGAIGEPTSEGFVYPTQVPMEGNKHWNIDRFIIDPQYGPFLYSDVTNSKTGAPTTTPQQARYNTLADMYKYYMLQDPEHRGRAFRKAKRFVRNEVDPRTTGSFYNSWKNNDGSDSNGFSLDSFASQNRLKDLYWDEITGGKKTTPEKINQLKDISLDYFKRYGKLSDEESQNRWAQWEQEANKLRETGEYKNGGGMFPEYHSFAPPMMANGGGLLSRKVTCSNCGHSWKGVTGGTDPLTCHNCGGMIKMKSGGEGPGDDELAFQQFFKTLPLNLRKDSPDYNIRGYWNGLGRPNSFDYTQPKEDDGYYHATSRNPQTGEILKAPFHPTFKQAISEDRKAGYFPIVTPDGKVKTVSGYDLKPGQSVYANGGQTGDPNQPYHPITNPDGYHPQNVLEKIKKLPNKNKPYEPSQMVNNAKALLAGTDLATGFSGNPYAQAGNFLARLANSTGDAYTAARYAMDGQWGNAGVDAGEALLDLIPFRKGKNVINLSKTNGLPGTYNKLSKLDKSLNNGLKAAKAGASADDFMHSSMGKFLFGDPDSQVKYKDGGGLLSRKVTCSDCGWSWDAVDGGKDVMTCHKCGGMIKMRHGGLHKYQKDGSVKENNTESFVLPLLKFIPQKSDNTVVHHEYNTPIALPIEDYPEDRYISQVTKSDQFLKNWYTKRSFDPRYGNVAKNRASEVSKIQEVPVSEKHLDSMSSSGYYNTGSKNIYINPNDSYSRGASTQTHEKTHELYDQVPQLNQDKIIQSLIVPKEKWTTSRPDLDPKIYGYDYFSDPSEIAARLNVFRRRFGLDPKHKYTKKEMGKIMKMYGNIKNNADNGLDKLKVNKQTGGSDIQELFNIIGNDPAKLAQLNDQIVMNGPSGTSNVAKNGGLTKYQTKGKVVLPSLSYESTPETYGSANTYSGTSKNTVSAKEQQQKIERVRQQKIQEQNDIYRLLVNAGMDEKAARTQSMPGVKMLDTTKKMLDAQRQKEYRVKMTPGYNESKPIEDQYNLADDNSLDTRLGRGKNIVMNQDLGLGAGVNFLKDMIFAPGAAAVNASHPYESYVKPGWKQGALNLASDAFALFPELPIKGAKAINYGVNKLENAGQSYISGLTPKFNILSDVSQTKPFTNFIDRNARVKESWFNKPKTKQVSNLTMTDEEMAQAMKEIKEANLNPDDLTLSKDATPEQLSERDRLKNMFKDIDAEDKGMSPDKYRKYLKEQEVKKQAGNILRNTGAEDINKGGWSPTNNPEVDRMIGLAQHGKPPVLNELDFTTSDELFNQKIFDDSYIKYVKKFYDKGLGTDDAHEFAFKKTMEDLKSNPDYSMYLGLKTTVRRLARGVNTFNPFSIDFRPEFLKSQNPLGSQAKGVMRANPSGIMDANFSINSPEIKVFGDEMPGFNSLYKVNLNSIKHYEDMLNMTDDPETINQINDHLYKLYKKIEAFKPGKTFTGKEAFNQITPYQLNKEGGQTPQYKRGGEYDMSHNDIQNLIKQGYKIQFI